MHCFSIDEIRNHCVVKGWRLKDNPIDGCGAGGYAYVEGYYKFVFLLFVILQLNTFQFGFNNFLSEMKNVSVFKFQEIKILISLASN